MIVPVVRRIWKIEKAKVRSWNGVGVLEEWMGEREGRDGGSWLRTKIIPTMVVPVAGATSKGRRSISLIANGAARHCGQCSAVVRAVALAVFALRKAAVCWMAAFVRMGLITPRMEGMTLELAVI